MSNKINLDLIVVGNIKEKSLSSMAEEYVKRIGAYSKLEIKEVKDINNNVGEEVVLKKEAKRIFKVLDEKSYIIVMEINSKQYTSEEFAKKFIDIATYHNSKITFIIGGSLGLDNSVKEIANEMISISKMTFPHQLFRIILLEQIYRGFRINNNSPYHK